MVAYYNILKKLEDYLLSDSFISNVTYGDLEEVDLDKTSLYPLAHFGINSVSIQDRILVFNMSLLAMDIVTQRKEGEVEASDIYKNDNTQYVLAEMLGVINRTVKQFRFGVLSQEGYKIEEGSIEAEAFKDRFADDVAGYIITFSVMVPNTDKYCNEFVV